MQQSHGTLRAIVTLALAGALTTLPAMVSAQDAANAMRTASVHDARWQPWLGCWSPEGTVSAGVATTMLCVVPGPNATSISIVNFSGGTVTERAVIAPGQAVAKQAGDCRGSETATWSADGRRVMLRGTFTCANGITRVETGVMAISADGDWVQAQGINVGGNPSIYVAHFRDAGLDIEGIRGDTIIERTLVDGAGRRIEPSRSGCTGSESTVRSDDNQRLTVRSSFTCTSGLRRVAHAEFVRDPNGGWLRANAPAVPFVSQSVRAAAGAPVTVEDVLEVSWVVDPVVTESWITDRNQSFELTGKQLVSLADRGMPSRVIDMLVAVSNPRTFTVGNTEPLVGVGDLDVADGRRSEPRTTSMRVGMMGMGWMYDAAMIYGMNPYAYGYGYGTGYGYGNGYGYGLNRRFGYTSGPPVVIAAPASQPRGRAVYGQGYTRGQSSTDASQARSSRSPWDAGSSSGGASSSTTSRGSSSGASSPASSGSSTGSSSGASSGGRTAKSRGGGN